SGSPGVQRLLIRRRKAFECTFDKLVWPPASENSIYEKLVCCSRRHSWNEAKETDSSGNRPSERLGAKAPNPCLACNSLVVLPQKIAVRVDASQPRLKPLCFIKDRNELAECPFPRVYSLTDGSRARQMHLFKQSNVLDALSATFQNSPEQ